MLNAHVEVIGADRARTALGEMIKRLGDKTQVLIGVQKGEPPYEDGTATAVIAAANHFGANLAGGAVIPPRPFLDVAVEKNSRRYTRVMEELIPGVMEGKTTTQQMLDQVGQAAASDVQEFMTDLRDPPNAPSTIAKKGSDNPLIDNGHLKQSIRHQIAIEPVTEGI